MTTRYFHLVNVSKSNLICSPKIWFSSMLLPLVNGITQSVQFSHSVMSSSCNPMNHSMLGFSVHHQLQEFAQTHVHWVGSTIQPSHALSSPSPPAFSLSQHQSLFQWVSSLHQVAKYWPQHQSVQDQLQHQSLQYSGLISFRMDWVDLLAVQGIPKSLLKHHSSRASFLPHSAFFIVQLSHPYMTTGKTIALTRWTFVGKVMSLLFNMLSRLVIAFLSRNKCLLISWL